MVGCCRYVPSLDNVNAMSNRVFKLVQKYYSIPKVLLYHFASFPVTRVWSVYKSSLLHTGDMTGRPGLISLSSRNFRISSVCDIDVTIFPSIVGGIILSFASKSDDANGTYKPALQVLGDANLQD